MQREIEKFIRYLEIEKNYSQHTILNFLPPEGKIKPNPAASLLTLKMDKHLPSFLTEGEVAKLLESAVSKDERGLRDRAILETFYSTGMRISELAGLNGEDLDIIGGIVKVMGKGKKERIVPIGARA